VTARSYAVHVVSDTSARDFADRLAGELAGRGHPITRTTLQRFPVADPLPLLLLGLAPDQGLAVVAVAAETANRSWVISELGMASLYPRVFLAVPTAGELPTWSASGRARVILPGDVLPPRLP
jgi:hypothetical protein